MRDALLLSGVIGFASGILCRSFLFLPWPVLGLLVLLALVCAGAWRLSRRKLHVLLATFLLAATLGAGRVMLAPAALPDALLPLVGSEAVLEGRVVAEPDIRETTQRVTVEVGEGKEKTKVLAVAPLYPEVRYGAQVRIEGSLAFPEPFITDTGRTFRYDRFLAKDGIFALAESASVKTLRDPEGPKAAAMNALFDGKRAFLAGLASALPEPGASRAGNRGSARISSTPSLSRGSCISWSSPATT